MLFHNKVPLQCKISYVVIPIVEIRQVRRLAATTRAAEMKGRGKGRGRGRAARGMNFLKRKGVAEKVVVYKKWPMLLPSNFARAFAEAGADEWMMLVCIRYTCVFVLSHMIMFYVQS